jgi:hypothetical protein
MRRPRIWMMMVGVAIAATVLGTIIAVRNRQVRFSERVAYHKARVGSQVMKARGTFVTPDGHSFHREFYTLVDTLGNNVTQEKSDWHKSMGEKYASATERPWQSVAPDPPEPK